MTPLPDTNLEIAYPIALLPGEPLPLVARLLSSRRDGTVRIELWEHGAVQSRRTQKTEILAVLSASADCWQAAASWVQQALAQISTADLQQAWQLLHDQPVGPASIAALVLGRSDALACDSVTVAICHWNQGFYWQDGRLQVRDPAQCAARVAQVQAQAVWQVRVGPWLEELEQIRQGRRRAVPLWAEELAQSLAPDQGREAMAWFMRQADRSGRTDPHAIAGVLREIGAWDNHDDLELARAGLLDPWPASIILESLTNCARLLQDDRPYVAIDNDHPHEVDDAVWATATEAGWQVRVAIASPSDALPAGSPADLQAARRGATLYHPRYTIGLLPQEMARSTASLLAGLTRPALVFAATVRSDGRMTDCSVQERAVTVAQARSYGSVDTMFAGDEAEIDPCLRDLLQATQALEQARIERGAYLLYKPDVQAFCQRFGPVTLEPAGQDSPARRMITEAMVLCCAIAAQVGADAGLALPYRSQLPPRNSPLPPGFYGDPPSIHAVLRTLPRSELTTRPAAHGVMALPAYVQVSSPLRRYSDLVAHRQLLAHVRGLPAVQTPAEVLSCCQQAESASHARRQAGRRGDRYFKLVWLAGRGVGSQWLGWLVRPLGPGQHLLWLDDLALEITVQTRSFRTGDRVIATLAQVNPHRGEIEVKVSAP